MRIGHALVLVALVACTVPGATVTSDAQAIALARQACAGKVAVPADVEPSVARRGDMVVVTFPTSLPPGTRGADYHARVTIDTSTGRVVEVLGGD